MSICMECFEGKIIDEQHPEFERLDRELVRVMDSGQFSYYAAFKRATRLYPAVMDCPECNGTGQKD